MRIPDLLRTLDLFDHLTPGELEELARRVRPHDAQPGEVLCRQGAPAESMFIVVDGQVQLAVTTPDGSVRSIGQVSAGESVGEIALFSGEPFAATATANTDTKLLVLQRDSFELFVGTRPHVMRNVLSAVSRRAARADMALTSEQPNGLLAAHGRVYAVFSPRSGAGKTTLALNLALRLAELLPARVGMLDLDLLFHDARLRLNLSPLASLASIPTSEVESLDSRGLANQLMEHNSGLRVLVGATRPEEGERVSAAHVRGAVKAMRRQFHVTVVDCGSNFDEPTLAVLETADRVIVLCTPELTTLRDVRDCQRIFSQALRLDKTRLSYIYNHPLPVRGLTRSRFETALQQDMAVEIPHAGDSASREAFARGTVVRPARRSGFGHAVDQLARDLLPADIATDIEWSKRPSGSPHVPAAAHALLRVMHRHAPRRSENG